MTRLLNLPPAGLALAAALLVSACATKKEAYIAPTAVQQDAAIDAANPEAATPETTKAPASANRSISDFISLGGTPRGGGWQDIGIGGSSGNEQIYAVGQDESRDNVWLFNNNVNSPSWTLMPGVIGRRITVDGNGVAWVVAPNGYIYKNGSGVWDQLPGQANDIGAAGPNVYIVGYGSGNRDVYIYQGGNNSWYTARVGQGVRIDTDNTGWVWLLTQSGDVYKGGIGGFTKQAGQLKDIGATCTTNNTGTAVYGIGYGSANKGIYENIGGGWYKTPSGEAVMVDVDQNGRPWVITANGTLYYSY